MAKFIICNNDNMIYYRGRTYAMGDDRYTGAEEFLDKTYPTKEQADKIAGKLGSEWQVKEVNESLTENNELKENMRDEFVLEKLLKHIKPEFHGLVTEVAKELAATWDNWPEEDKLDLVENGSGGEFIYDACQNIMDKLGRPGNDWRNLGVNFSKYLIDPTEDWFDECEELLEEYVMPSDE